MSSPVLLCHVSGFHFGMLIPVLILGAFAFAILSGIRLARKREELWHSTARLALEKGQPVPSRMEFSHGCCGAGHRRGRNDVRSGLIMLGLAAGLYVALLKSEHGHASFAAIPAFIGVALLINAAITAFSRKPGTDPEAASR